MVHLRILLFFISFFLLKYSSVREPTKLKGVIRNTFIYNHVLKKVREQKIDEIPRFVMKDLLACVIINVRAHGTESIIGWFVHTFLFYTHLLYKLCLHFKTLSLALYFGLFPKRVHQTHHNLTNATQNSFTIKL